ncbi:helix-turn-helix domain-containing protein [Paenibacillus marinisediminis]
MDKPQTIIRDHIVFPDPLFPFTASTTEGVNPEIQRLHWHHALELNYIRSGSGFYLINGVKLQFKQGDILFINSDDLHRVFETENLVMDIIMFDPSMLAFDLNYDPDLMKPFREINIVGHEEPIALELKELFHRMMTEYITCNTTYISLIRADLVRFLGLSNRFLSVSDQDQTPLKQRGICAIKEAVRTMEMSLGYAWTLQELAAQVHLSPSRFSALFQQAAGTSPLNYLIQLRLTHAVHLLETTEMKIIHISEQCGFRNLSNFNRLFKQHVGKSPRDIREYDNNSIE